MPPEQSEQLGRIEKIQEDLTNAWIEYWNRYSHMGTWQFWFYLGMLVVPLIILYFAMDRKRALLLGFFGFNIHVWFTYIDAIGIRYALWDYPYSVIPVMIGSLALDVSLVPVAFMLTYQWVLHRQKNYYLYGTLLSALFAFVLKPILVMNDLFHLNKGTTYFQLFLGYMLIMLISKWITNLFLHFIKERENPLRETSADSPMFSNKEKAK